MGYSLLDVSEFDERRKPIARALVSPDATRQVVAGPEGLGYLVVGAEP